MKHLFLTVVTAFFVLTSSLVADAYAQDIHLINRAGVPRAQVRAAQRVISAQANGPFATAWSSAHVRFVKHGGWPIYLQPSDASGGCSGVSGAAGWHDDLSGAPYAYVCTGGGWPWSKVLSHELLEMLADPTPSNAPRMILDGVNTTSGYLVEVGDPVNANGYVRRGITLSDFTLPPWYAANSVGLWDRLAILTQAFQLSVGGYANYWDGYQWVARYNGFARPAARREQGPPRPPGPAGPQQ